MLFVFCVILVGNDGILLLVFTGRASEEEESLNKEELREVLSCCLPGLFHLYMRSVVHRVSD